MSDIFTKVTPGGEGGAEYGLCLTGMVGVVTGSGSRLSWLSATFTDKEVEGEILSVGMSDNVPTNVDIRLLDERRI